MNPLQPHLYLFFLELLANLVKNKLLTTQPKIHAHNFPRLYIVSSSHTYYIVAERNSLKVIPKC